MLAFGRSRSQHWHCAQLCLSVLRQGALLSRAEGGASYQKETSRPSSASLLGASWRELWCSDRIRHRYCCWVALGATGCWEQLTAADLEEAISGAGPPCRTLQVAGQLRRCEFYGQLSLPGLGAVSMARRLGIHPICWSTIDVRGFPNYLYQGCWLPAGHYAFLDQPQLFLKALLMQTKPYRSVHGSCTLPACLPTQLAWRLPHTGPVFVAYLEAARLLALAWKTVLSHWPAGQGFRVDKALASFWALPAWVSTAHCVEWPCVFELALLSCPSVLYACDCRAFSSTGQTPLRMKDQWPRQMLPALML